MICCKASLLVLLLAVDRGAATTHDLWQHASPQDLDLTGESPEALEDAAAPVEDVGAVGDPEPQKDSDKLRKTKAASASSTFASSLRRKKRGAVTVKGRLELRVQQVTKEINDYNTALQEITREVSQNLESATPKLITQQTLLDDVVAMEAELRELEAAAAASADEHKAATDEMAELQRTMAATSASAERVKRLRELEEENLKLTEQNRNLTEKNAQLKQAAQLVDNPVGYAFQQWQDEFSTQDAAAQELADPHRVHQKSVQDEFTMGQQGAAQALAESHDLHEKSVQCASVLRAARDEISKQESLHEQLQSGIQKLRSGVPARQLNDMIEMFFAQRQELINATTAFQHREREILRQLGSIVDPLKALQAMSPEKPRGSMFLARGSRELGPQGPLGDLQHLGGALRELREGLSQVQGQRRATVGALRDEASSLLSVA